MYKLNTSRISLAASLASLASLALAATAMTANAQSSVTLYGLVDVSVGSFENAHLSTASSRVTAVESGKMTTSYLGFSGVEDLGNMQALFTLETFLRADTGAQGRSSSDPFWGRNAHVGLRGSMGTLLVGRTDNMLYQQALAFNPFGASYGFSPIIRLTFGEPWGNDRGDSAWSNSITFVSPNVSGLTVSSQLQLAETKSENDSAGLTVAYASGPLGLSFGYQAVLSAEAPKAAVPSPAKQAFTLLGASYDFGMVKMFGQAGHIRGSNFTGANVAGNYKAKVFQFGVSVPVTANGKVLASYGQEKETQPGGDIKHSILSVGYDHLLSKRTDLYAAYMRDDEDRANWEAGNTVALGMRVRF